MRHPLRPRPAAAILSSDLAPMTDTGTAPKPRLRLTALSHGAGCACKLGSVDLSQVLRHLPAIVDPRVLVDAATRDDAAVFRLSADRALVATTDFFTPIVDDPRAWGAKCAELCLRVGRHPALLYQPGRVAS